MPNTQNLKTYFERKLPYTDVSALVEAFSTTRMLKRQELLVQPGQQTSFLAYLNAGACRVYFYNENADEITTWFSFQGEFVTDLLAYYKGTPAAFYVEAIEPAELLIAQKETLEKCYAESPDFQEFGRKFAEEGMVLLMERMMSLQTKSATERYLELLEQPEFMAQIPLKYLATYLGVTDTSLSRIRKNLAR